MATPVDGVTRTQRPQIAVHDCGSLKRIQFGNTRALLRHKPTSIDWGMPVGIRSRSGAGEWWSCSNSESGVSIEVDTDE